jgi:hypothetical protein
MSSQEKDAHNPKSEPQGTIRILEIRSDCGLEVDDATHEITINLAAKAVLLRAANHSDALAWVSNIASWRARHRHRHKTIILGTARGGEACTP